MSLKQQQSYCSHLYYLHFEILKRRESDDSGRKKRRVRKDAPAPPVVRRRHGIFTFPQIVQKRRVFVLKSH